MLALLLALSLVVSNTKPHQPHIGPYLPHPTSLTHTSILARSNNYRSRSPYDRSISFTVSYVVQLMATDGVCTSSRGPTPLKNPA